MQGSGVAAFLRGDVTSHWAVVFFYNATPTTEIYTLSLHERSSDLTFYLNGVQDGGGSLSTPIQDAGTPLRIGERKSTRMKSSDTVNEYAVYSTAITASQVANHYTTGTGKAPGACSPRSSPYSAAIL